MDLNFYYCALEGRQLRQGETSMLPCKKVMRAICQSDYQNKDLVMTLPKSNDCINHEHVKAPKDGLFLMRVSNPHESYSLHVLFDTRTTPDFVMIEKREGMEQEGHEVQMVLERALSQAADQYGWKVRLDENPMNVVRDFDLFVSAMEYLNGKEECIDFRSFIIFRQWADELMNKLHLMLKDMVKPKDIMRILRAAYDARLILKPDFDSFVKTFDKEGMVSYGTYKHYMRYGDHPLKDEDSYKEYLNISMKWKEKWVD